MQDHDQYLNELRQRGYITRRSLRTGHLKIYDRHGCLVAVHSGNGGSDYRALANLKSHIRRHACLRHGDSGGQAQQARRGNPAGGGEPGRDRREEPQRAEHERAGDQDPAQEVPARTHHAPSR